MGSRRARALPLLAVLLLAALAASVVGPLVHTDDGCAVEQHCTACRTALASLGVAPPAAPLIAVAERAEPGAPDPGAAARAGAILAELTRGPPAAL